VSKPYSRARMRGAVEVVFLLNPMFSSVRALSGSD
jgi:hypothetical protein